MLLIILAVIALLILGLFLVRLFSHSELDDVSPGIPCSQELLEKAELLWIIPNFENKSISENKEWCGRILSLNKTLGLHGVYHTFEEFKEDRNEEYLSKGIDEFEECFGFKPELFKPPQLAISANNKKLIKNNNLKLKMELNQLMHKVYHCSDTGVFPNWFIELF